MIGHGVVSGALFMSVGVLYDRRKTKMIKEFGGLAHNMPIFALVYAVVLMASVGLPLTIGFIGEFLSLLGFFKYSPILTLVASLTIVLSVIYMLSMYKRTFFGNLTKPENKTMKDIFGRELVALGSLVLLIIALGIYPKIILDPLNTSVTQLTKMMEVKSVNEDSKEKLRALNSIGEVK
jgi:NADH-quinone oxidoreductase subunit M